MRRLKTDDLLYLLAVADTGRVSAAADHLNVDASTVSRRLRVLEKAVGSRVLSKSPDGWELTDFGRLVADRARPIQDALEGVARAVGGESADVIRGEFRLTAPDGFATVFAVPALTRLRSVHPDLHVELLTATRQLNLHQAGFDLAVAVGAPVTNRLVTEPLSSYRLAFYATDHYLAKHGNPCTIDDLRDHSVIFYVDSLLQVGDLDFGQYAPGVETTFTSTSLFAQLEAAACGAGIALLPRFIALRHSSLRELTDLVVDGRLQFSLAARRESVNRPAVRAVRMALHHEVTTRAHELL